jgi:cysteine desulfuration protein SufE
MSIEKRFDKLKDLFVNKTQEEKIIHLLEMGRALPPYPVEQKTPACLVSGCQSTLYLFSRFENSCVYFEACADALISAGLASLLFEIYSGEPPEIILKTPPSFLSDLGILESLTPSRSNGLAHIHQRIKKDSLKYLLLSQKSIEFNSNFA